VRGITLIIVGLVGSWTASPVRAQSVSDRVGRVRDGTVRLSFATRDLVCGDGQFIGFDLPDAFYQYSDNRDGYSVNVMHDVKPECRRGPVRLVVVKSGGRVTELRAAVGVAWRPRPDAVDLGPVSAADAAEWLVDLAEVGDDAVGRMALLAAAAADSARITGRVLDLARNRRAAAAVRERAIRWAAVVGGAEGRGDEVDQVLLGLAADAAEPTALRERAVRDLRPSAANRAHLRSLYDRVAEPALRERILREMASGAGPDEIAWLRKIVLDPGQPEGLRDRALRVLAEESDRMEEVRALYPRLDRLGLRDRALRLIAEHGGEADEAWVREVAENPREEVALRDRAIRLLGERGRIADLRRLYRGLDRMELRERVLRTVAEHGDADAAEWLAAIVLDEREAEGLRDRAVRTLAERGEPSGELATLYDRVGATALKQRLIRLLDERGDQAAADKLAAIAAGDPNQDLRREAARRLGDKK
jgi:hypothetical protein